jgi:ABC-type uncharacterized transport system substrate-binding protein
LEIAKEYGVSVAAEQKQGIVLVTNAVDPVDKVKNAIKTLKEKIDTIYKSMHIFRF